MSGNENKHDYTVKLDDVTGKSVSLYLYKNVENIQEVFDKILKKELPCCILKANLILEPFHIVVAANKAAINEKFNQLVTKSLYSEVIFCLSISKNISQSLTTFGITKDSKDILVVLIYEPNEKSTQEKLVFESIKGELLPITKLSNFSDIELIKKTYKIEKDELSVSSLINSIVSRISDKIIK